MLRKTIIWLLLLVLPFSQARGEEARVFDRADLLLPAEEQRIEAAIAGFQERTNLDFVVLISDEPHPGQTQVEIAESFYTER